MFVFILAGLHYELCLPDEGDASPMKEISYYSYRGDCESMLVMILSVEV